MVKHEINKFITFDKNKNLGVEKIWEKECGVQNFHDGKYMT